jgi:hypothetical protein
MLRPSPRLAALLLWIALAMLPLRGWASAVMPMTAGNAAAAGTAALPCHGDAPHGTDAGTTQHGCTACDLCHAGVAQPAPMVLALPALPAAAPCAMAPAVFEQATPDDLFRPPRTFLA